ncbi:DEKNAAC104265 [Brettanomyces naardenensis]|uniref:DEKNAAC104265 n=1 Tax=Brettanomyces naardenensis TaxID=13370 RepID=A0A448YQG3_BRENA|nr:DEKNAAC104265 [Brettanomyces naardenensis]
MSFIGVDIGSRSVRSVAIDSDDNILASSEVPISYQIDPDDDTYITANQQEVWDALIRALRSTIEELNDTTVSGICIDATCSLVVSRLEPTGELVPQNVSSHYDDSSIPDRGIVFWMDHRGEKLTLENEQLDKLGGSFIPEMAIPKLRQIYEDVGEDFKNLKFFDLHDWFEYRLVGEKSEITEVNSEPGGVDGSLKGFHVDFLNKQCGIPIKSDQIGRGDNLGTGLPFAGQPIGFLDLEIAHLLGLDKPPIILSGLIDCYASFFATFYRPISSVLPQETMIMVAGTSACFLTVAKKPRDPPKGIWGGFRILPDYWFYEGGLSCCGILIENLFRDHPCGFDSEQIAKPSFWDEFETTVDKATSHLDNEWFLNAHKLYSGDYLGNRTPYSDSNLSAYIIGDSMIKNKEDLVSRYLLILEYIVLQARLILECFIDDGFLIRNVVISGSLGKNERFLRLLQMVMSELGIRVMRSGKVDFKTHAAFGSAELAKYGCKGREYRVPSDDQFEPIKCSVDPKVVALMDIKRKFAKRMRKSQQAMNEEVKLLEEQN